MNEKYKLEVNRLHNTCQSFENLPKVTERVSKNFKHDSDNHKEVKIVIVSLSELVNQETLFEKENNELTENSTEFFDMKYAASIIERFQSENSGGDVLQDRKTFTHMEKFSGNCRDWPQFRRGFEKQVENVIKDEGNVSYALRNALPDNMKSLVRNMSDDIKESWRRLNERYGDEGKIVESVLNNIKH